MSAGWKMKPLRVALEWSQAHSFLPLRKTSRGRSLFLRVAETNCALGLNGSTSSVATSRSRGRRSLCSKEQLKFDYPACACRFGLYYSDKAPTFLECFVALSLL